MKWRTSYETIAHANEEVISDSVRKAQLGMLLLWLVLLGLAFGQEFALETPSIGSFLFSAMVLTVCVAAIYGALIGLRTFAHNKPRHWHFTSWIVLGAFLLFATTWLFYVGANDLAMAAALTLIVVGTYYLLMRGAKIEWEANAEGVSQTITILGHRQRYHTSWKEVTHHRVHTLTGAVEIKTKGQIWHMRPRVHLIVPEQKHRKAIHRELSSFLTKR